MKLSPCRRRVFWIGPPGTTFVLLKLFMKKKPFQSKLKLFRNASLRPPASHRLRKGQNHQRQAELVSAASTGRSRLSGHGSDWCERCQVERRRTRGDSSAGTGAPAAEPLDICFTISLCCKTEQEGGRGGGRKKNHSSILFSTLRRATSGSVTLHLHRTISPAKVHKNDEIPCHLPPDLCSGVTRRGRRGGRKQNNHEGGLAAGRTSVSGLLRP